MLRRRYPYGENMAVTVHEEAFDLHLGLLETAGPPGMGPWPLLRSLGRAETRTFRAVVLENDFLRLTLLPELGGRIAAIHDRRTGIDILPRPATLEPVEGGPRGVDMPFGIEVTLDGGPRLNALGPVRVAEAEDGVWLAESVSGNGLSWHLKVSLPEERAAIGLELRVFNRLPWQEVRCNAGFRVADDAWTFPEGGFHGRWLDGSTEPGLLCFPLDGAKLRPGLDAYDTVTMKVELVPFSGPGEPWVVGEGGAVWLHEGTMRIQSAQALSGAKAILLTDGGQTLEAPIDLLPSDPLVIEIGDLTPVAFLLIDADRRRLIEWNAHPEPPAGDPDFGKELPPMFYQDLSENTLRRFEYRSGSRAKSLMEKARRAMFSRDYEAAAGLFERSLLFNAENPLAWWGLAAAGRLAGEEGERPELMNARWLAPLEPMVRAEIFLSTPVDASADPSGLLDSLDETPDVFIEVAATLIDHGLWHDAARWLDEALRRHPLGSLHLLAANAHLEGSGLTMEAERHFRRFQALSGPPYPWRPVEMRAKERLQKHFL